MLEQVNLDKVLFLDIETVPQAPNFQSLETEAQQLWTHKAGLLKRPDGETIEESYSRAGIYAEFGKIICVSVGYFSHEEDRGVFKLKSFYGDKEADVLGRFIEFLLGNFNKASCLLCAHNGKEFDFPYLCRRILINRLKLPPLLNIAGKKPWEIQHLDTLELWRFGDYKNFIPLNLLANIFGIKNPKDDIDGSMVWKVYWQQGDLERIKAYCQKDVVTIAQLVLAMKGIDQMDERDVIVLS